jgi:4-amino-4-deoxy-L-arabinose transferase-like glycosyltransferase
MARAAMIGLPAISLAMLSLGSLMRYLRKVRDKAPRNRRRWAALSGLLMSASFLTKPTMIYMAAWIFAWFCWRAWRVPSKTSSEHQPPWERELLIWTSCAMLPLLVCLIACGQPIVRQVVGTYLHPVGDLGLPLDPLGSLAGIGAHVVEADLSLWILLALGGVGLWALIGRQPEGSVLFLGVWLTTMLVITMQAPFRGRYMFLFLLPHTILAGVGLAELAQRVQQRLHLPTTAGQYVAAVAALLLLGYLRGIPAWFAPADPNPRGMAAVAMVSEHTAPDDLLITDQGMIAFRAGRSAVPYLSVISGRRIRSGNLTADELIAATANADPRMVIFWEDKLTDLPTYVDWVEGHYRLLHRWDERHRVYLREE